jgi:integrase
MKIKSGSTKKEQGVFPTEPHQLSTDAYYGMSFSRLEPKTIISRSNDGKILSRLEDDEWVLIKFSYSVTDNPRFSFLPLYEKCDYQYENVMMCKKILVMKMFAPNPHLGKPLRIATLHSTRYLLYKLAQYCAKHNLRVVDVLSSIVKFREFQVSLPSLMNRTLAGLVRTLSRLTDHERGFKIDGQIFPHMQKACRNILDDINQTPVIPSRILFLKHQQYNSYIDDFNKHYLNIYALLDRVAANPFFYGKASSSHYNPSSKGYKASAHQLEEHLRNPISFEDAIREHSLDTLAEKFNWTRNSNILAYIMEVSHCAKNLIHMYTLMRDHEVRSLSPNCITPVRGWNNDALYIAGITTKLYGVKKPRKWITTDAILKPVEVLGKIHNILKPFATNAEDHLFLSVACHPASNVRPSKNNLVQTKSVETRLPEICITEDDIQELEAIDPLRDWRGDPHFQIGKPWKISSHQFRRTMAVFCAQTGLITLPSLKRLLGHITKVMSLYYTKGCFAETFNFSLINPRLAKELRQAKAEADGAMFIREALNSSEKLYGFKGSDIMREAQGSNPIWIDQAVNDTMKLVKKGLAAYAETPLGGCASVTPCDKRAHGNFYSCPGCRHLIAKESVLDDTQTLMEYDLAELDPNSIEYKAEKQNLEDFIELRNSIIKKAS